MRKSFRDVDNDEIQKENPVLFRTGFVLFVGLEGKYEKR